MSRPTDRSSFTEDAQVFADPDFDADDFIDSMETDTVWRPRRASRTKPAWKRLEELNEDRELRKELAFFDD